MSKHLETEKQTRRKFASLLSSKLLINPIPAGSDGRRYFPSISLS